MNVSLALIDLVQLNYVGVFDAAEHVDLKQDRVRVSPAALDELLLHRLEREGLVVGLALAGVHLGEVSFANEGTDMVVLLEVSQNDLVLERVDPLVDDLLVRVVELEFVPLRHQVEAPHIVPIAGLGVVGALAVLCDLHFFVAVMDFLQTRILDAQNAPLEGIVGSLPG